MSLNSEGAMPKNSEKLPQKPRLRATHSPGYEIAINRMIPSAYRSAAKKAGETVGISRGDYLLLVTKYFHAEMDRRAVSAGLRTII